MSSSSNRNFTLGLLRDSGVALQIKYWQERFAALASARVLADSDGQPDVQSSGDPAEMSVDFAANDAAANECFTQVERGNAVACLAMLRLGFDPNMRRARWGDTVLHIAATRNARDVARVLIESGKCDYLLRDRQGNLASTNAYLYGRNSALARFLSIKEKIQAKQEDVEIIK